MHSHGREAVGEVHAGDKEGTETTWSGWGWGVTPKLFWIAGLSTYEKGPELKSKGAK